MSMASVKSAACVWMCVCMQAIESSKGPLFLLLDDGCSFCQQCSVLPAWVSRPLFLAKYPPIRNSFLIPKLN